MRYSLILIVVCLSSSCGFVSLPNGATKWSIGRDVASETLTGDSYTANNVNESSSFEALHQVLAKYFRADVAKALANAAARSEDLKTIENNRTSRSLSTDERLIEQTRLENETDQLRILNAE